MDQTQVNVKNNLAIPIAIVLAGALIAGAIFITNQKAQRVATAPEIQKADIVVPPITSDDHMLGNPNAKIMIVEYSDFECPYCQDFHPVMKQVMDKYGKDGEVAWVYRHYWAVRKHPQTGKIFHPLAGEAAEASECVAELGGESKFWAFNDNIFQSKSTQVEKLGRLSDIAAEVGVDKAAFETCLKSDKYAPLVQKAYDEAVKLGVTGTPTSFIIVEGVVYPISGYIPFEELELILKDFL
ncbi:MAG TPA: thioredoxin domain-containing protein [Candidatus Paceibacterota bacterium]|nr:thioredoxin domain-containing protein [Candidatus Paceibacterota bacterium]